MHVLACVIETNEKNKLWFINMLRLRIDWCKSVQVFRLDIYYTLSWFQKTPIIIRMHQMVNFNDMCSCLVKHIALLMFDVNFLEMFEKNVNFWKFRWFVLRFFCMICHNSCMIIICIMKSKYTFLFV